MPFPYLFYRQPGNRFSTGSQAHNMLPSRGRVGGACAPVVAAARGGGALASEVGGREADGPPNYEYRHVDPTGGFQQIPQARMRPAGLAVSARDDYVQISEKKGVRETQSRHPRCQRWARRWPLCETGRRHRAAAARTLSPLFSRVHLVALPPSFFCRVSRGLTVRFLEAASHRSCARVFSVFEWEIQAVTFGLPAEYTLVRDHHQTKMSLSHHTCVLRLCAWDR